MKNTKSVLFKLMCLGMGCLALPVMAQAPVSDVSTPHPRVEVSGDYGSGAVDPAARTYSADDQSSVGASTGGSESGNLLRQIQQLQEEVGTLRGQLEEQAYELQKLKQQHQDDFASIDRRLGSGGAPASASSLPTSETAVSSATAVAGSAPVAMANGDGKEEYEAAYARLKSKDYPGATEAFRNFVVKYPSSDYAGNSWFWLGFVYQTQGDVDGAAKAFASLIERFPNHAKAEDAKYNLGKIYHQQGKTDEARRLLKEVAAGNSKSAPLAKSYLDSM